MRSAVLEIHDETHRATRYARLAPHRLAVRYLETRLTPEWSPACRGGSAPATFTRLAWAVLLGYVVFSEIPDVWTIVGALVIFASTTLLAYREARESRARMMKST